MKRAFIYTRVSTEDQRGNWSMDGQEQSCREFCQRSGYDVIRAMSSPGQSVAQELRHLKQLLDAGAISQQQYDAAVAKVTGAA